MCVCVCVLGEGGGAGGDAAWKQNVCVFMMGRMGAREMECFMYFQPGPSRYALGITVSTLIPPLHTDSSTAHAHIID